MINSLRLTRYERDKLVELKAFSMSKLDKINKNKKMEQLINALIFDSIKNESSNVINELSGCI
ncbi:MAG: hypothetical protein HRT53_04140 [Colwellia sp.]|nr:hypothetical protein [Colwellia sp.]